jgi:hypothetical protein
MSPIKLVIEQVDFVGTNIFQRDGGSRLERGLAEGRGRGGKEC